MKKSIKRIIAVCLAVLLIASAFAGCSKSGGSKKYTVGICQLVQHEALDAATKGFKEALIENSVQTMLSLKSKMRAVIRQPAPPSQTASFPRV